MAKYSLEIKPSAGKELDALDHALFSRIDRKILALAENPRPAPRGAKSSEATKTNGASAWVTGAWCSSSTMTLSASALPASLAAERSTSSDSGGGGLLSMFAILNLIGGVPTGICQAPDDYRGF